MRSFGFLLIVMGIGSFILKTLDMEFRLLLWVDTWGTDTGNIIRIAAAAVGAVLVFLSYKKKPASADTPTTTE